METNTSLSLSATTTTTETMNEVPPRHGAMEICCCENDDSADAASICSQVGLALPGDDGTGKTGRQSSSSLSASHFNGCQQQQQHKERRRIKQQQQQQKHHRSSSNRRRLIPFSSLFLLLLLTMATRRQTGLLLPVNAQPSKNENELWEIYMPTPDPSNLSASLIPTRAPTPRPASAPQDDAVPSPRPALFPIFWAFEPTPAPAQNGGGDDDDPTPPPAPAPVMAPKATDTPTPAPVWQPPVQKTLAPAETTSFPSSAPSLVDEPVTASPSDEDVVPTSMPSSPPVFVPPTQSPSSEPTTPFPSSTPTTESPTTVTGYPTITPQPTPRPSRNPTFTPTTEPSAKARVPTTTPTLAPTLGVQSHYVDTVMKMTSMATKIISGIDWESATESHIKLSIQNNNRNLDPPLLDLEVKTDIKQQDFLPSESNDEPSQEQASAANRTSSSPRVLLLRGGPQTNNRALQFESDPQPLQVQFVVRLRFRSEETLSFKNVSDLVGDAFNSEQERELYIERLQQTTNQGFPHLTTIDVLVEGSTPIEEPNEPDPVEDDDGDVLDDSTLWIIIGAAGGGFLAIVALGFLACRRIGAQEQKKRSESVNMHTNMNGIVFASANQTASHNTSSASGVKPFVSTEILVDRQDDVSTLGDPVFGNGMMGDHGGAERDEQTASVGNDYDYSKQYLRAQGISGSLMTDNSQRDRLMSADSGRSSFTSGGINKLGQPVAPSVFSDDASYDQQFMMDEHALGVATEQRFDVTVPPGKLGMVVDTPNGGCPVVHAIKTESILANRVQVGDRLVAVDSEDVTAMTAVQVSKLISLRSDQDRKLVFVRFISPEAAMMMRTHSNYSNGNGHHGGGAALADDDDDEEEEKEPNMMGP